MSDKIVNRELANELIHEQLVPEIVEGTIEESVVLKRFKRLPNMSSNITSMPVLDQLPMAYFVDGDTGLKKTTEMSWDRKKIHAEEIAVIVPIPDAVLADAKDSGYDLVANITPRVVEAFSAKIDAAILFGDDKPENWEDGLVDQIEANGNVVTSTGDLFLDIMGEDGVISEVEKDGYAPNAVIGHQRFKAKLRGLTDKGGRPMFATDLVSGVPTYTVDGMPVDFSKLGIWEQDKADAIVGDFEQAVYAIRQDMTIELFKEGVITDADGKVLLNLMQQDSKALRFVMRLGWATPNYINRENAENETRYPFAILKDGGSGE